MVSYRQGLDPVLKGLNIIIPPKMKVGVCGRTGAGIDSLIMLHSAVLLKTLNLREVFLVPSVVSNDGSIIRER